VGASEQSDAPSFLGGKTLFWDKSKVSNCGVRADTFCQGSGRLGWEAPHHLCWRDGLPVVAMGYGIVPLAEDTLRNGPAHALEKSELVGS